MTLSEPVHRAGTWRSLLNTIRGLVRCHPRMAFGAVGLSILWLFAAWVFSGRECDRRIRDRIFVHSSQASLQVYESTLDISRDLERLRGIPVLVAGMGEVAAMLEKDQPGDGVDLLARSAFLLDVDLLVVVRPDGRCLAASNQSLSEPCSGSDLSRREYFRKAVSGLNGEHHAMTKEGKGALFFSAPVMRSGRVVGVVAAIVEENQRASWVSKGEAFLSDPNGVVLLARDKKYLFSTIDASRTGAISEAERVERYGRSRLEPLSVFQWSGRPSGLVRLGNSDDPMIRTRAPVPNSALELTLFTPVPEIRSIHSDRVSIFLLAGLLGSVLILLAAALVIYWRELVLARAHALQASRAKSEFLATMSHELRTPLNGVIGFASLLEDSKLDAAGAENVRLIQTSARSLLAIVSDILDFSRIESGHIELHEVEFSPHDAVRDCVGLLRRDAESKGIELCMEGTLPERVRGDDTRFQQILTNLVANAVKFTPAGKVDVILGSTATDSGVCVEVDVRDTGIGMSSEEVRRIFDPFVQADATTSRRFGGTGLGLAIANQLVHCMGGTISVRSTPGAGSTFTVKIPFRKADPAKGIRPGLRSSGIPRESLHLLVVEDNEANRKLVTFMLRRLGHRVETVEDGQKAIEAVETTDFDAILMDIQMPEMDGRSACREIRARFPAERQPWIIALTANALEEERQRCLEVGMDDFLTKPFTEATLVSAFQRIPEKTRGTVAEPVG